MEHSLTVAHQDEKYTTWKCSCGVAGGTPHTAEEEVRSAFERHITGQYL